MKPTRSHIRSLNQRGAVLPFVTLVLFALFTLFGAFSFLSFMSWKKMQVQWAADGAAIGAARYLQGLPSMDANTIRTQVTDVATQLANDNLTLRGINLGDVMLTITLLPANGRPDTVQVNGTLATSAPMMRMTNWLGENRNVQGVASANVRRVNLVLVLDRSGSMGTLDAPGPDIDDDGIPDPTTRIAALQAAASQFIGDTLIPGDGIGVYSYNNNIATEFAPRHLQDYNLSDPMDPESPELTFSEVIDQIKANIDGMASGGWTNIQDAIRTAAEGMNAAINAGDIPMGRNIMVISSDGAPTWPQELVDLPDIEDCDAAVPPVNGDFGPMIAEDPDTDNPEDDPLWSNATRSRRRFIRVLQEAEWARDPANGGWEIFVIALGGEDPDPPACDDSVPPICIPGDDFFGTLSPGFVNLNLLHGVSGDYGDDYIQAPCGVATVEDQGALSTGEFFHDPEFDSLTQIFADITDKIRISLQQ